MTTATLDLSPMIRDLKFHPGDFTLLGNGDIRHIPSNHDIHWKWFRTSVEMRTERAHRCDCHVGTRVITMTTTKEQRRELRDAARVWLRGREEERINKQFAGHF